MREKFTRRLLSLILTAGMVLSLLAPASIVLAKTLPPHYLAFASDRHDNTTAIGSAMKDFNAATEYACIIGDAGHEEEYKTSTVVSEIQALFPDLPTSSMAILYGYEHDDKVNDDAGIMCCKESSSLIYSGPDSDSSGSPDYYVYGISYVDMQTASAASNAAENFKTWIDSINDLSIPVFVVCHYPMHAKRNDNNGGYIWANALNVAATGSENGTAIIRDVVFMHGHNHTVEDNQEWYYPTGTTLAMENDGTDTDVTIQFTYFTAGYMRETPYHATQITLTDDSINFNRTGTDLGTVERVDGYQISLDQSTATLNLKTKTSLTLTATVTVPAEESTPEVSWDSSDESVATVSEGVVTAVGEGTANITASITYGEGKTRKAVCKVTVTDGYQISLDQSTATLNLKTKTSLTLTATVTVPAEEPTPVVSWNSSNPNVATVSEGVVTAVGEGTANITASITYGEGKTKTAVCKVSVTAATMYHLVSEVESGKSYLIVSNGYALTNTDGTLGAAAISGTAGDSTITTDGSDTLWTFTEESDYTDYGTYSVANAGTYIARSSKSGGSKSLTTATEASAKAVWTYDITDKYLSQIGGNKSTTTYYVYYSSSKSAFYTSSTSANTYLYEKNESVAGDVDQDGDLDMDDAKLAKQIAMKDPDAVYTQDGLAAGDYDGNGKITINEARKLKRMVLLLSK